MSTARLEAMSAKGLKGVLASVRSVVGAIKMADYCDICRDLHETERTTKRLAPVLEYQKEIKRILATKPHVERKSK